MSEENVYDLVVIGGGPAGYAGAIRAGQLGKKVACVEMERPGGTCLNWGCIPTKALLKSAELYETMKHSEVFGFQCEKITVDFAKVMLRSRTVADQMSKGISFLFKKNKVEHIFGKGSVNVPGLVEITSGESKGRLLQAKNILLATGCRAKVLPGLKPDGERVLTCWKALQLQENTYVHYHSSAPGAISVEVLFSQSFRLQGNASWKCFRGFSQSRTRRFPPVSNALSKSRASKFAPASKYEQY